MQPAHTLKAALLSDWAPAIRQAVTHLAYACALAYALGHVSGTWVHRANDRLAQLVAHHGQPVRHALPAAPAELEGEPDTDPQAAEAAPEPPRLLTTREAALMLVAEGASYRLTARTLGVSDRTVRRWLREAA